MFLTDCVEHRTSSIYNLFENLPNYLQFDEFQLTLLKGFSLTLIITLFLIYASWRVFGKNICERFMKPATSKTIEELKASVSRLKLPKEHSPRI
ncbi:PREDICTED: uncharacterized protein LOC108560478 isoform X2 [Nicrophorus vespilloides]|uniref:Uncharacterized protein LOC108560478 isoform X2 n=1 Tax=Nicrophorus vespilloides TaxID=110193 RepID=A0ABM1MG29_NICVS|nr:PREDICTED: uncharacterized protein LOC108560478 isoform X2 [Nicrophorus vespilloides]